MSSFIFDQWEWLKSVQTITALTVFPFSSQVMVGTGFPVALHCRATRLP